LQNTPDANGVAVPTWQFTYDKLRNGADLGVAIPGHALTLYSFSFNDRNNDGKIQPGEGSVSFGDPGTRTPVTCAIWENNDPSIYRGYPYLLLNIYNRTEYLQWIIAESPAPQPIPHAVEAGNILVLTTTAPFGALTLRGGILCAVGPAVLHPEQLPHFFPQQSAGA
jgi:hypothetical protein